MKLTIKQMTNYFILGLLYGAIYMLIELLYRGYTHYSMGLLAFCVGLLIGALNEVLPKRTPLILQGFLGACIAIAGEYLFGMIFNKNYEIWSYLDQPFNFQGQVCLKFFSAWYGLSIVVIVLDDYLKYMLFNGEKPSYNWLSLKNKPIK